MYANCFGAYIDIYAIDTAHFAFAQHSQDPLGGFFRIVEQCIRLRARNQSAAGEIIAVRENFARDLQTTRRAGTGKIGVVRGKQN